jgi:predicted transcriptional regulator
MIISLIKEQKGHEYVKEMEKTYKSIENAEKILERTQPRNMVIYVQIQDWKYYKDHPDETIKISNSLVTNQLTIGEVEIQMLNTIKHSKPKSIRELAKLIKKDISTVQPKVKNLETEGLLYFEDGVKNSKVPCLNYDEISISI